MKIITSHYNLDFDGLASMVAASKLNEGAVMYLPWSFGPEVRRFYTFFKHRFKILKDKDVDFSKAEKVIIVDAMSRVLSPQLKKVIEEKNLETIIYDHHSMEDKLNGQNIRTVKINYGACTTYFVEELLNRGIEITNEEAMLFMLGIFADTSSFTSINTTPTDMKVAAKLMEKNVNMKAFSDFLKEHFETPQIKLFDRLLKNLQVLDIRGHKILLTYARLTEHVQQLSDVTSHIMSMNAADAVVSVVQMGNKIFVVGRSSDEKIDISRVVLQFQGGGHKTAAAAVIPVKKGVAIKGIRDRVYGAILETVSDRFTVADIMTSPVRAISPELTMEEAYRICIRFNNNGLPIVASDKLTGFITKEDIEKGILHNLGSIPVSGYMSGNVITAEENFSIPQAQQLMIKYNIGHLPVVKDGKLTGILTRADIFEFLYKEKPIKKEKIIFHEKDINMKDKMEEKLDKDTYGLIMKIGEYADEMGVNAYLVGGIVRDLFLNEKDMDVDITVEGDGMQFARFLADKMGGAYKGFERFKTGKVFLDKGRRIDVTSARAEFYEFPAALPEIEFTPIRYDLYRRDFTINAMAVQINRSYFGRFNDYFNGFEDLQKGIIRTLYNMSFIDDPTRILRAVRFEQRYNFKIEENTMRFIEQTLKYNIFENLPGERIKDELFVSLEEANPFKVFKRMHDLNILARLGKKFKIDLTVERIYQKAAAFVPLKLRPLVYFMIFTYNMPREEFVLLVDKLKFKSEWRAAVISGKDDLDKVFKGLHKKAAENSEIYFLLNGYPEETLYYFMAACDSDYVKNRIENYLHNLKNIKPEISGSDLKQMNIKTGPEYGKVIAKVLEAKLNGKLKSKQDELDYVKKLVKKKRRG
ncbi:MAG TPA: CBS domain-containing protein [Candidatus Goldiibacteriota bacterium]|nr:CBS domain-containing protein [Candidatus Goldiibacteriota bacterium]